MNKTYKREGFTIIEVVLVLAIAGLIFLMVFIALPALQRSQRDTQRRNDYSMLSTAVSSYSTNNGGKIYKLAGATKLADATCTAAPGYGDTLASGALNPATYINSEGTDPNGYRYQLRACTFDGWNALSNKTPTGSESVGGSTQNGSQVYVVIGANCDGSENGHEAPAKDTSSRAFVIYGYLEGGNQTYCASSQ